MSTPRPAPTTATNDPSAATRPGSTVTRPGSVLRPGSTVPRPGSTLPNKPVMHPGQGQVPIKQQQQQGEAPTIMRTGTPMNVDQVQPRGKKREREEVVGMNGVGVGVMNGVAPQSGVTVGLAVPPAQAPATNGYVNGNGIPKMIANAKAGTAGVRPRPIKKQKMVSCSPYFLVPSCSRGVLLESSSTVVNGCADLMNFFLLRTCKDRRGTL